MPKLNLQRTNISHKQYEHEMLYFPPNGGNALKDEIYLSYIINSLNGRGKNPRKHFAQVYHGIK